MKPKIRVTLLTPELVPISDRLIDAYTELLNGPSETHKDPYRLEVTLDSTETIDKLINYINKLRGTLPLEPKVTKTKNPKEQVNPYKEVYLAIKGKNTMDEIIDYLHSINFRFISTQLVEDLNLKIDMGEKPPQIEKHQMMARVLKYAKDPMNDKLDFTMLVFIKFLGKPSEMLYVAFGGKIKASLKRPWTTDKINMKQKKVPMVFPKYMTIEERKQWRQIRRSIELGRDIPEKRRKFHDRFLPDIQNANQDKDIPSL